MRLYVNVKYNKEFIIVWESANTFLTYTPRSKDKRLLGKGGKMCCTDVNIDAFILIVEIYHYFMGFPFDTLIKYHKLECIKKKVIIDAMHKMQFQELNDT